MKHIAILAASSVWTAERSGEVAGACFFLLLVLFGIIKCGLIMRRPTTNKLCVCALLVLLTGWLIAGAGGSLTRALGLPPGPLTVLTALLGGFLAMAAVVLGIVGLATHDRQRFTQGRAQAGWAVALGALMVLGMVTSAVMAAIRTARGQTAELAGGSSGKPLEKPEFNFSITPSPRWVGLKPAAVNKLACLALRRTNPDVFCVVIGERMAGSLDLEQLKEVSKSNLVSAARVLEQKEETVALHGLTFARINTKAHTETVNMTLDYEHWLATQHGFAWQVVFWTSNSKTALAREARAVMETFKVLDPALDGAGKGTVADVQRPGFGYRTKLDGLGWTTWTDSDGNALADFRAQRLNEALMVLPLRFDSEPPDLEALSRGLLSALELHETPEEEFETKPWTPGHGGTGQELQVERDVDGDLFRYILRIARGRDSAHLIAGWSEVSKGDPDLVRRSLDAIRLEPAQGAVPVLTPAQKKALGLLLNNAAISLLNRGEHEKAAALFYQGFQQGGDPTVLGNAGDALERAGKGAVGRDMLAPHMDKFPGHHYLGLRYARLQALSGDGDAGEAMFRRLVDRGLKDEDELLNWLTLLTRLELYPPALRSADAWISQHPTVNARRWQAQVHAAGGDTTKAIALLEKLMEENPKDSKVALDLGRYYNDADEHAKAAAIAEKMLADGRESPRALTILGWSQMGRKWYRDAKATFERAAKKLPEDADIQDAIRRASAALGQGDNSDVKDPIEPVALPAEVASALDADSTPQSFGEGHPSAWLMRATGYHFQKGRPTRRTIHRRVKVLTAEGAKDFSSVEIRFRPLSERIFMNRLEVKNAAGAVTAKASLDDAYVRDLDSDTASHDKVLHMQVAGVQPGSILEWEVTLEDRSASDSFEFQRHLFASGLPVAHEAVFVVGGVQALHAELAQGGSLKKIRTSGLAAWIAPEQPAAPSESYAVWAEHRCPMLWLGGDGGTWEKTGRDYLKQIEDRLTEDKSVSELSATLVAEKRTEREKVAAIARHVQKEIGYKAIEFGVRARRPNAAADTLRLRYGDCKDTALLMHLLLRAAGIVSHLTLVNTDWDAHPALTTLDQFNHMVVHVPSLGKNWLLDATDKSLALAQFPADSLWHAHALVLDPSSPRLIPPPVRAAPESSHIDSRRSVTVEGNDWRVEESLALTGYYAGWMRGAFTGLSIKEQRDKAQGILADQGAAQVHDFRFENLDATEEPARVSMTYTVREGVNAGNGHRSGALPALWERDYLGTRFIKERQTAFEWIYPLHFTGEVTARLPAPAQGESVESLAQQARTEFCEWHLKPEARGSEIVVHFDFVAEPGEHPAGRYAAFHDAWESARRAWDKPLVWKKE